MVALEYDYTGVCRHTFAVHNGNKFIPVYIHEANGRPQIGRICSDANFPCASGNQKRNDNDSGCVILS